MKAGDMTRRDMLLATGGAVVAVTATGCGAVGPATKVVIEIVVRLPWARILSVVATVLIIAEQMLRVVVRLQNGEEALNALLGQKEIAALQDGGKLILESADGERFEVPFTIERS